MIRTVFIILFISFSFMYSEQNKPTADEIFAKKGFVCKSTLWMTERLYERVSELKKLQDDFQKDKNIDSNYIEAPRIVLWDYVFAHGEVEFDKLNTYGIIMFTCVTKDKNEHPIDDVYFCDDDGEKWSLGLIYANPVKVTNRLVKE